MEDKYQEREKRPGSARIPPRRGQIKARILRKLVQKVKKVVSVLAGLAKKGCGNDWTDGSLFCFWDKTSLISEFANITRSFCFLFSFSASMFMLETTFPDGWVPLHAIILKNEDKPTTESPIDCAQH
uniref:Uncharacterized protein n=1 Tax=Salix viminalis TaxID=40686 RepID=A0A6N2LR82_SALVM